MRYNRKIINAMLIWGFIITGLQAQNLYVNDLSNRQIAYPLNHLRKISFSDENLIIEETNTSKAHYSLNELRLLNFKRLTSNTSEQQTYISSNKNWTSPNPVAEIIKIDLTGFDNENGIVAIYTLEGKLMVSQNTSNNSILDLNISHLPQGIYICRYFGSTGIKAVKIIKQ